MARRALLALALLVTCASADPPWYQRRDTWTATVLATRAETRRLRDADAARGTGTQWSPWRVLGPLFAPANARSFDTAFPPETGIDLAASYDNGRKGKAQWTVQPKFVDGIVHDLTPGDNSATYLYRTVTQPAATKLTVYLGSDDGLTVWCNGRKVLAKDVPRGCSPNEDSVELDLKAGENQVLLKINNQTGGYAFYFSTSATPGAQTTLEGLWPLLDRDFPDAATRRQRQWEQDDRIWSANWPDAEPVETIQGYLAAIRRPDLSAAARAAGDLAAVQALYHRAKALDEADARLAAANLDGLRRAIDDLIATYGERYPGGPAWKTQVDQLAARLATWRAGKLAEPDVLALVEAIDTLRRDALLANPRLAGARLLLVKRRGGGGLPANWQGNSSIGPTGYDNELATLSPLRPEGALTTLYRPEGRRFVGDLCLHFDGRRLLFSMPDAKGTWQVHELSLDGGAPRQVTPGDQPDIQCFDGCYLPDGRILFCSTACYQGVPCVAGSDKVSLLYQLDPATGKVRQLTFDQDHSWDPTVLNNGRVLYTRWEYSDTPHYFTRILFGMNPDGTEQQEFYGSNSYWPNSLFYARPIPGSPSKVVAIVSGHHGVRREGELVILDPARGRREADGVVQRIPSGGKPVEPKIIDQLVEESWPRFLHPLPLDEKHFLVACRPTPRSPWGIYLADTFDNLVLVKDDPDYALFEPTLLEARPAPPAIVDKVQLDRTDATVYLADVYRGPGLAGVPRGTVKRLRVYADHFAYPGMGGHQQVAIDGPWDVKRILGTVPVEADGSAHFTVPANTPIAVQPLDAEGQALQVMRSWMTAMPGETLSCVGCHESQNTSPPRRPSLAARTAPRAIEPFYGPARGFSFRREVQPVLDRYCVECHGGTAAPDLRDGRPADAGGFSPSYLALHPYVRRPGPESDYHLLPPGEFHASTSELVQLLRRGHHQVSLDREGWDRLITWIDLNAPCLGTWHEDKPIPGHGYQRRQELRLLFANLTDDNEAIPATPAVAVTPAPRRAEPARAAAKVDCPGWPFDAAEAQRRQAADGPRERTLDLGDGQVLTLVRIPAGEGVVGDPPRRVAVGRSFQLGRTEVTNAQYARFDPAHDSRYISETNKDQTRRGIPVNEPDQPVVRVTWQRAEAFCRWLSERTGLAVSLPSEDQWEYACRAGTATPFWFGELGGDFSPFANLADKSLERLARADSPKWHPRDGRYNDGATVTTAVGKYQPNPWGLCDMVGNAAEWTSTADGDGRVVRGGSWYDRPQRATASFRWSYPTWMPVYNVGFRVLVTDR